MIDSYVSATIHQDRICKEARKDRKVANKRVAFHNPPNKVETTDDEKVQQDDAEEVAAVTNFHTGPRNGHSDSCCKGHQYNGKIKVCRYAMPRRAMSETTCQEIEMKEGHKYPQPCSTLREQHSKFSCIPKSPMTGCKKSRYQLQI